MIVVRLSCRTGKILSCSAVPCVLFNGNKLLQGSTPREASLGDFEGGQAGQKYVHFVQNVRLLDGQIVLTLCNRID